MGGQRCLSRITLMATNNAPCASPSFTHFIRVSARFCALISVVCGLELVAEIMSYMTVAYTATLMAAPLPLASSMYPTRYRIDYSQLVSQDYGTCADCCDDDEPLPSNAASHVVASRFFPRLRSRYSVTIPAIARVKLPSQSASDSFTRVLPCAEFPGKPCLLAGEAWRVGLRGCRTR